MAEDLSFLGCAFSRRAGHRQLERSVMDELLLSLNEVESQATKAARGAGLPWGLAEDAGQAARKMAEWGQDWSAALLALLCSPNRGERLRRAAYLADRVSACQAGSVIVGEVDPSWAVPLLALAGRARRNSLTLRWAGHEIVTGGPAPERPIGSPGNVVLEVEIGGRGTRIGQRTLPATRARVPAGRWREIDAFAARTYVPASAESRLVGAGAGLDDND